MLHVRVISPPDRTVAVRDLLLREPGATHVSVLPGVALAPAGDLVEAGPPRAPSSAARWVVSAPGRFTASAELVAVPVLDSS